MRYEGPLTPPTTGYGSLYYPGVGGGMNWGSVAVDEVNHLMVVNSLHNPSVVRLIPRAETEAGTTTASAAPRPERPMLSIRSSFCRLSSLPVSNRRMGKSP